MQIDKFLTSAICLSKEVTQLFTGLIEHRLKSILRSKEKQNLWLNAVKKDYTWERMKRFSLVDCTD